MKKYFIDYLSFSFPEIHEVEVIRETDKQAIIIYNGRERRKERAGHLFDSREEAVAYYVSKAEAQLKRVEDNLEYTKDQLATLKAKFNVA